MAIIERLGGAGACWTLAGGILSLLATGCGQLVSWDERWMFDTGGDATPSSPSAQTPLGCQASAIRGYHYPDPPELWLGSQTALDVSVSGTGYLVAGAAGAPAEDLRFSRVDELFVAPDGTLSLGSGEPALGYAPGTAPGGACLVELRAPVFSPPRATSRIDVHMNFDPRVFYVTFDVTNPLETSNASTSLVAFDSIGAPHVLHIYFTYMPGAVAYYVLADGSDLAGGTPGTPTQLSAGELLFTSDGALSVATTPALDVSFYGLATTNQVIELGFGPDITNDGSSGYAGSTMFATSTQVFSQSVDGHPAGASTDFQVGAAGNVLARFDNGDALEIGSLALARFPREAALAPLDERSWVATADSGAPQFSVPQAPGRGSLVVTRP